MTTFYAVPAQLPVDIVRAVTQTLTQGVRDGAGAAATVISGTITITNPAGTAVVDGDAIVVSGNDATYSLLNTLVPATLDFSRLWVVSWTLVTASGTHYSNQPAHLVARTVPPPVDASHVLRRHPPLSTQYTAAELQPLVDDAWIILRGWIVDSGHHTYQILSMWKLAEILIKLSLSLAFRPAAIYTNGSGVYSTESAARMAEALADFSHLEWDVDADQDGTADDDMDGVTPVVATGYAPFGPL